MTGCLLIVAVITLNSVGQEPESCIKSDEVVVFFPTLAAQTADGTSWEMEIHGWIHEPATDPAGLGAFGAAIGLDRLTAGAPGSRIFRKRAKPFFADNERGKEVAIRMGDTVHVMPESASNGHFRGSVRLTRKQVLRLRQGTASGEPISFKALTRPGDQRAFAGRVYPLGRLGISVISDIDDTVKISNVRDKSQLLKNTFVRKFRAVDGMAGVYNAWKKKTDVAFHYVSASP